MKILLTGATGFVGSAFLRLALDRGHTVASLVAPGRVAPSADSGKGKHLVVRGTLGDAPWRQIEAFQAETCLHTAWITTPGAYLESPENDQFLAWSQEFLARFFECGGLQVVGMGTCIEYRMERTPLSETRTPAAPTTRYARCKDQLRTALLQTARPAGRRACWARLFYPYGPGEHPARLCSHLIRQMRQGAHVSLATPDSVKDYIYIEDVAEALLTLIERRAEGVYNVGTGEECAVKRIAGILAEMLEVPVPAATESSGSRPAPDYVVADTTRLRALGWHPQVTLEAGLARLVAAAGRAEANSYHQ